MRLKFNPYRAATLASVRRTDPATRSEVRVRAFTLTEIAIVLGVIGIILGAIWGAAAAVQRNHATTEASTEILTIIGNWQSIYGGHRVDLGDWTDITSMTISNKYAPPDMIRSGVTNALYGPWANSWAVVYTVQSWNAIAVQFMALDQASCNSLGAALALGNNGQLVDVYVTGTEWQFPPLGTTTSLRATDISAACQSGNGNLIRLSYAM